MSHTSKPSASGRRNKDLLRSDLKNTATGLCLVPCEITTRS
jgi:hypothetical protein